jgi:hypothetical protein
VAATATSRASRPGAFSSVQSGQQPNPGPGTPNGPNGPAKPNKPKNPDDPKGPTPPNSGPNDPPPDPNNPTPPSGPNNPNPPSGPNNPNPPSGPNNPNPPSGPNPTRPPAAASICRRRVRSGWIRRWDMEIEPPRYSSNVKNSRRGEDGVPAYFMSRQLGPAFKSTTSGTASL